VVIAQSYILLRFELGGLAGARQRGLTILIGVTGGRSGPRRSVDRRSRTV